MSNRAKGQIKHQSEILTNLFCLESEPGYGYRCFSYLVEFEDFSVLIDVNDRKFIPQIRHYKPARHLILTHRHTRLHEAEFENELGVSVWMHPDDAHALRRGPALNTPAAKLYNDPFSGGLEQLGLRFFHIPGHTPGCCFIFLQRDDGILFVGDALVGPRPNETPSLTVPPPPTSDDDSTLRNSLKRFVPPLHRAILPFHGEPVVAPSVEVAQEFWNKLRKTLD